MALIVGTSGRRRAVQETTDLLDHIRHFDAGPAEAALVSLCRGEVTTSR